ncbi:hypothetical protein PHYC_02489 [Phycisphaerales bacterium]|nr:hypothetical protein PHYC_02489 [Phycisphaerales bacterium]
MARMSLSVAALGLAIIGLASCNAFRGLKDDIKSATTPKPVDTSAVGKFAFSGEPEVRIRIAAGVTKRDISGPRELVVRPVAGGKGEPTVVKSPLTVTSSDLGVVVTHAAGRTEFPFGADIEIGPTRMGADGSAQGAESLKIGQVRYPGFVTIRPRWSTMPSAFDAIVTMPVESYLPGVLTHELWKDWPRQTYEAQAIAARTYALHERSRARAEARTFDVEDTTNDQVYGGSTAAYVPNEAARSTRGLVLVSDNRLLRAYYSSTCGGRPASAAAVWRTDAGYEFNTAAPLQGQPRAHFCQPSKHYRWEVTRSDDDVGRRLRAWGTQNENPVRDISRLRAVDTEDSNAAERPNRFKLTDDRGRTFDLTAEELRVALNHPVPGLAPVTMENNIKSGDLIAEVWANQVKFRGRGWGHGVGMCQWCAKGMADQGMDWASMLKDFYPGAEVVKAY